MRELLPAVTAPKEGENNMQYFKTMEVLITDSYPYGRLRTKAFFSVEFNKGKGFRSVFQTINPKTGKLNKPKKGTYANIMLIYKDKQDHFQWDGKEFYSGEKVNELCKFISEHFDLFTPEQQEHIAIHFLVYLKSTAKAQVIYCGSNADDVLKIMDNTVNLVVKGIKEKRNFWSEVNYPHAELEAIKKPNYNPFVVTNVGQ